jgi:hypothetical protein
MKRALLGTFLDLEQAVAAMRDLSVSGFPEQSIGIAMLETRHAEAFKAMSSGSPEIRVVSGQDDCSGSFHAQALLDSLLETAKPATLPDGECCITAGILADQPGCTRAGLVTTLERLDVSTPEAGLAEVRVQAGCVFVAVLPAGREILAGEILSRHGAEIANRQADVPVGMPIATRECLLSAGGSSDARRGSLLTRLPN